MLELKDFQRRGLEALEAYFRMRYDDAMNRKGNP